MVIKNNHLSNSGSVNKSVTSRKHMSTKMLTVLTAKNSSLSTSQSLETRMNAGASSCVYEVDAVDSYKPTSLKPFFTCYP